VTFKFCFFSAPKPIAPTTTGCAVPFQPNMGGFGGGQQYCSPGTLCPGNTVCPPSGTCCPTSGQLQPSKL